MGDVNRDTDVGEMEAIAQPDQRQGNDMMANKFLEVLPRLLQLQQQHNRLLSPVACLKQVVSLEEGFVFTVREVLEHGRRVEIPDIRSTHDVQPERTKDRKVYRRVDLFHEPRGLPLAADPTVDSPGPDQTLHEELPGERQHNGVERHKRDILLALTEHGRATEVFRGLRVGQEDGTVHRVRRRRIDGVHTEQDEQDEER